MNAPAAQPTNLAALRAPQESSMPAVAPGFGSLQSFELMQRAAKLLSSSTLVPAAYRSVIEKTDRYGNITDRRENPSALANSVVALNMAQRMGADPLMVMQNLYIVEGRPSWSSQWIIAAINGCGRFSPLRFDIKNLGKKKVDYVTFVWENKQRQEVRKTVEIEDKVCVAWTVENGSTIPQFSMEDLKKHGGVYGCCKQYGIPLVESPVVSIEMAVKEGWYTKTGSKWQTMDEVMLRYRTASFFGKLYAPELLMGLQTTEEAQDAVILDAQPDGTYVPTADIRDLRNQASSASHAHAEAEQEQHRDAATEYIDAETGEIHAPSAAKQQDDGLTLADAHAAVRSGDLDLARDISRGLPDQQRQQIEAAIANLGGGDQQNASAAQQSSQAPAGRRGRGQGGLALD